MESEAVKEYTGFLRSRSGFKHRTSSERSRLRSAQLRDFKAHRGCKVCEEKDPRCLDFHHRDPKRKEFDVTTTTTRSWPRVWGEIQKCDVLCANYHRKLHAPHYD